MGKWLKDHGIEVIMLLFTFGSSIAAIAFDTKAMLITYPLQSILLSLSMFALGFTFFWLLMTQTQLSKDRRTLETVKGLPPQLLAVIERAYIDGLYPSNYLDHNVQHLLSLGFLGSPAYVSMIGETQFVLKPWFKSFLDRNYNRVFYPKLP